VQVVYADDAEALYAKGAETLDMDACEYLFTLANAENPNTSLDEKHIAKRYRPRHWECCALVAHACRT
jgi:hypothetical protein